MKTIVETATGLSKYLLADDLAVAMNADDVIVGDPPQFIVADLSAGNAALYEGVTAPDDWIGNKYIFDGDAWTLNPAWIEPEQP